jgi:hypothetical protein
VRHSRARGRGAIRVLVASVILLVPLGSACSDGQSGEPACAAPTQESGGASAPTTCPDTGTGGGY